MWPWIWLGIIVLCIIIEIVTMELVSVWFVLGSLVSLILAFCNVPYWIQIVVAIAISAACLAGLRKISMKLLGRDNQKLNMERTFGKTTKLLTPIVGEDVMGTVKVNDVVYNAKSENGEDIEAGKIVELISLDGNKYIVKEKK